MGAAYLLAQKLGKMCAGWAGWRRASYFSDLLWIMCVLKLNLNVYRMQLLSDRLSHPLVALILFPKPLANERRLGSIHKSQGIFRNAICSFNAALEQLLHTEARGFEEI